MERATEMILEIGKPIRDIRPWMSAIFFFMEWAIICALDTTVN